MSDTPLAAVILAHGDPVQLHRLIGTLEDVPISVHCDARTAADTFGEMAVAASWRVRFADRIPTRLASWSLVRAELLALRDVLKWTSADHVAVFSGADYPLVGMDELYRELRLWEGRTWMANAPMPHAPWATPRHDDGGMWRLQHHFFTRRGNIIFVRDVPLRWPVQRRIPPEIEPRAASQWKVYARHHVERLLELADTRPDLIRFWKSTLVPDESMTASMLASADLLGEDRLPAQREGAWFLDWDSDNPGHPKWLEEEDFDALKKAVSAPDASVAGVLGGAPDPTRRKLFARKMSTSRSSLLLDRIDGELRSSR